MASARVKKSELTKFSPLTPNQKESYKLWKQGNNLVLTGSSGTGKTFVALNWALDDLLKRDTPYDKIILVRSIVAVREMGFLPGKIEDKVLPFEDPYKAIISDLFNNNTAYNKLITAKQLAFETTSFIRGKTFNNAIVIVDEMQNLNFHELDSIITRIGINSRIIFCGDYYQSDFNNSKEKEGINSFLKIIENLNSFKIVEFGVDDIVRSDLVKQYIIQKESLKIS